MKFAQFQPGQELQAGPYEVSEPEIVHFAEQWDPQWFHTDAAAAREGPFEGLIASGWHTCCIAMRMAALEFLEDSEFYASPGLAYIKWPHPVRPGDSLRLKAHVLEVRTSSRGLGIMRWRWQLFNQHDKQVLDLEATSLFKP